MTDEILVEEVGAINQNGEKMSKLAKLFEENVKTCPRCGEVVNRVGAEFCPVCGRNLDGNILKEIRAKIFDATREIDECLDDMEITLEDIEFLQNNSPITYWKLAVKITDLGCHKTQL